MVNFDIRRYLKKKKRIKIVLCNMSIKTERRRVLTNSKFHLFHLVSLSIKAAVFRHGQLVNVFFLLLLLLWETCWKDVCSVYSDVTCLSGVIYLTNIPTHCLPPSILLYPDPQEHVYEPIWLVHFAPPQGCDVWHSLISVIVFKITVMESWLWDYAYTT